MSLFSDILNVHNQWLELKGYDRQTLALTRLQEDLPTLLRNTFETVIRESLWSTQSREFSIPIAAHFGRHNQENVDFVFGYRYDPKRIRLDLLTLRASMKGEVNTWLVTNKPYLLPRSATAYEYLRQKLLHIAEQPNVEPSVDNPQKAPRLKR